MPDLVADLADLADAGVGEDREFATIILYCLAGLLYDGRLSRLRQFATLAMGICEAEVGRHHAEVN